MKILGKDFSEQVSLEADRAWTERMVHEMQLHLPRMLRENADRGEFWRWFCGEAESLFRHARHDEDRLYFQDFINRTLEDAGLEARFERTRYAGDPTCAECTLADARDRDSHRH